MFSKSTAVCFQQDAFSARTTNTQIVHVCRKASACLWLMFHACRCVASQAAK